MDIFPSFTDQIRRHVPPSAKFGPVGGQGVIARGIK